jgi:hypothetical protein
MSEKPYQDEAKLRELYSELQSQQKVADEFGVSASTVKRYMDKFGIEAKRNYPDKVTVECDNCEDDIEKIPSLANSRENHFCNQECYNEWQIGNTSGSNNNNWKEPAEMDCEWCGTHFQFKNKYKEERRFCSYKCANKWKSEELGEGRYDEQLYYGGNWRNVREKVIERDSNCQICGHDGSEYRHEVHHITPLQEFDSPKEANKLDNLILLCSNCHRDVKWGKKEVPKITNNES